MPMHGRLDRIAAALVLTVALGACGGGGAPDLLTVAASQEGPDEFGILPNKPLQRPEDLDALPPPTPGGANRGDLTPAADAVTVLGGRPGAGPAAGALVAHAGRYGVSPQIRRTLAAEDLVFRQANDGRLLERLFNTNIYFRAYRPQSLDQYLALERLRQVGVRTPAAPPAEPR